MPRDIETIDRVYFHLYASETDMMEAEKAVFGFPFCHISELDWYPSEEDDEKPDNCDRVITYCNDGKQNPNTLRDMYKIAAYLGNRCWLSINVTSRCVHVSVDTQGRNRMSIYENHLHDAMQKRIDRAVSTLRGYGEKSDD